MQSSLLHIILFIVYSLLLGAAVVKMRFFRDSGLRPSVLLLFFGIKVVAGCLHNIIAYKYYPGHGDIWSFFLDSFRTKQDLFVDGRFFGFATWKFIPHNSIQLLHILFNVFSFDNLYINTLLFSFLVCWGSVALFRCFREVFPDHLLSALAVWIIPSTLFWTSCVHAEGLLYIGLGFFFYSFHRLLSRGWKMRGVLCCLFFAAFVLLFRPAVFLALLPAAAFLLLAARGRYAAGKIPAPATSPISPVALNPRRRSTLSGPGLFLLVAAAFLILLLAIPGVRNSALQAVSDRQKEFQVLEGHSRITLPLLEPDLTSVLHVLPYAVFNGLFEPLPGVGGQKIYTLFALELLAIWIIGILALYRLLRNDHPGRRLDYPGLFGTGCLLFALLGMIIIGAMIPFVGAIVRYRSIFLPFLLAPFLYLLREAPLLRQLNSWLIKKVAQPLPTK